MSGITVPMAAFLGSPPSSLSVCCWGLRLETGGVLLLGYLGAAVKRFVACLFLWRGNNVIAVCEMYVSWGRAEWVRAALAFACSCCFARWGDGWEQACYLLRVLHGWNNGMGIMQTLGWASCRCLHTMGRAPCRPWPLQQTMAYQLHTISAATGNPQGTCFKSYTF
ncbi:hypothetical protein U1Q18_021173 [Sarracenia purpurea var. burkii]